MDRSPEIARGTSGESAAVVLVEHLYRVNRVELWIALVVLFGVVLIGVFHGRLLLQEPTRRVATVGPSADWKS
jgi:hypothetical protein